MTPNSSAKPARGDKSRDDPKAFPNTLPPTDEVAELRDFARLILYAVGFSEHATSNLLYAPRLLAVINHQALRTPARPAPTDVEAMRGRIEWHSSEEDGGPDVGVELGLGDGRSLYIGELANATVEGCGIDPTEFGGSWWLALFSNDADVQVIASVANDEAARDLVDQLSAALRAPAVPREVEGVLLEAVERAIRHAINIGIDDGSSYLRTLRDAQAAALRASPTPAGGEGKQGLTASCASSDREGPTASRTSARHSDEGEGA